MPAAVPGCSARREPPPRRYHIRHDDTIRETLPQRDEAALEFACEMTLVRIPDTGFIRYRRGIQGRGRWDGHIDIFRCIVLCRNCHASECNKRMWYKLDNHESHLGETCLRDHKARSLRR